MTSAPTPPTETSQAVTGVSKLSISILMIGLVTVGIGQSILFAILPPAGREIGFEEYQIAAIFTAAALAFILVAPFWGRLSDRIGRKPLIVIGLYGYAVTTVAFAWFADLGMQRALTPLTVFVLLASSRLLYSLVASGIVPASQAYMADCTDGEKRMAGMAGVQASYSLGMILGPGLVPISIGLGLMAPMYIAGIISAVAATAVLFFVRESKRDHGADLSMPRLRLRDPRIWAYMTVGFGFFVCMAGLQQIAAFYYQDILKLTSEETAGKVGTDLIFASVAAIATQITVMRYKQIPVRTLLICGFICSILSLSILMTAENGIQMTGALIVFGIALGVIAPAFMTGATLAVSQAEIGAVSGLATAAQGAAYVVGPLMMASLYQVSMLAPFIVEIIICVLLLIFTLRTIRAPAEAAISSESQMEKT